MSDGDLSAPDEFSIELPPNSRIRALKFEMEKDVLHVFFDDDGAERVLKPADLLALHGGYIRSETLTRTPTKSSSKPSFGSLGMMAMTGMPINPGKVVDKIISKDQVHLSEEFHFVLGLRVARTPALWYLRASSFNFRTALGPEATYSTEINCRQLVRRLCGFAPDAVRDNFITAYSQRLPLPPALNGLIEFLRVASGARL
ncbi:MAG: hypothetical protein GIX02_13855 [Candidatus Eremiobacteraeota bacterium]|nr:hypothetical protein [Candidatus Eremiobacteraeota bacterium]